MKHFLIALFAIALLAGAPLVAQEGYENPDPDESQTELQAEAEVEADVQTDELDAEANLTTEDEFGDEDEFGAEDEFGDDELPATGSELPLAALLGLLSLVGAVALRVRS